MGGTLAKLAAAGLEARSCISLGVRVRQRHHGFGCCNAVPLRGPSSTCRLTREYLLLLLLDAQAWFRKAPSMVQPRYCSLAVLQMWGRFVSCLSVTCRRPRCTTLACSRLITWVPDGRCMWPTRRAEPSLCGTMTRAALRPSRGSCRPRWACPRACVRDLTALQQPWTAKFPARRAQGKGLGFPAHHELALCMELSGALGARLQITAGAASVLGAWRNAVWGVLQVDTLDVQRIKALIREGEVRPLAQPLL